jgi:hypothetical protein
VEKKEEVRVFILVKDTASKYGTDIYKINGRIYKALARSKNLEDLIDFGYFGMSFYELIYAGTLNQTAFGEYIVVRPLFFNDFP